MLESWVSPHFKGGEGKTSPYVGFLVKVDWSANTLTCFLSNSMFVMHAHASPCRPEQKDAR